MRIISRLQAVLVLFSRLSILYSCFLAVSLHASVSSYSYDSLSRLTNAAYSDGSQESYSYDPSGNRLSRVTLAAISPFDLIPPSVPTNLVFLAFTPSRLTIGWNPSHDTGGSGLAGYRIYVGASLVATTTSTNFSLSGLLPGTQYCLSVAAVDRATNMSAQSTMLCTNTPIFQPPLLTSPEISTNGHFQFTIENGTAGPYDVLTSTNLIDWQIWTNLFLPTGNVINDSIVSEITQRFYQLRWSTNAP